MPAATADRPLQIGALAAVTGLTRDALRYYERLGLLPRPHRTSGGFRLYPASAPERVRFIRQAQRLGMSLAEIAILVRADDARGADRCVEVRDLLRAKLEDLQRQLAELETFGRSLRAHLDGCDQALASASVRARSCGCPLIDALRPPADSPR